MAIVVNRKKCDACGECVGFCPFGAIEIKDGCALVDGACRICGACLGACGQGALVLIDDVREAADRGAWGGILVFGEMSEGRLHPVVRELIGKALELAGGARQDAGSGIDSRGGEWIEAGGGARQYAGSDVGVVLIGDDTGTAARELLGYGVSRVYTYEHEAFRWFKADAFAAAFSDVIGHARPGAVLVGATSIGRSLAPRVSTRLRTGLTADCTGLELTEEGDLVQIRPAFGGNIMARIITPGSRPQFATVRYRVMDAAPEAAPRGEIIKMAVTAAMTKSGIEIVSAEKRPPSENISEAEVLVVGGKGLKSKEDLEMVKALAEKLNGGYAVTRPLVEAGWAPQSRQIGLSGRTVKPKLLMAFGVSGAVQFTAAMRDSECIFAVNSDAGAPIMDIAHYGVVGDLYEILPGLLET